MTPTLVRRAREPYDWAALLDLIRTAFAGMEGRIDPPSSLHRLTPQALADMSESAEIWVTGAPPLACMILTPLPHALDIGKLAVAPRHRGKGHAARLLHHAAARAHALHLPALELQTRVELTENHAIFRHLGFAETTRSAHPGFARPTAITFTRTL